MLKMIRLDRAEELDDGQMRAAGQQNGGKKQGSQLCQFRLRQGVLDRTTLQHILACIHLSDFIIPKFHNLVVLL